MTINANITIYLKYISVLFPQENIEVYNLTNMFSLVPVFYANAGRGILMETNDVTVVLMPGR